MADFSLIPEAAWSEARRRAEVMRRLNMTVQNWMLMEEGSKASEGLNITLGLMVRRAMERRIKDRLTINEQLGCEGD